MHAGVRPRLPQQMWVPSCKGCLSLGTKSSLKLLVEFRARWRYPTTSQPRSTLGRFTAADDMLRPARKFRTSGAGTWLAIPGNRKQLSKKPDTAAAAKADSIPAFEGALLLTAHPDGPGQAQTLQRCLLLREKRATSTQPPNMTHTPLYVTGERSAGAARTPPTALRYAFLRKFPPQPSGWVPCIYSVAPAYHPILQDCP